jgi:hypothetical protein
MSTGKQTEKVQFLREIPVKRHCDIHIYTKFKTGTNLLSYTKVIIFLGHGFGRIVLDFSCSHSLSITCSQWKVEEKKEKKFISMGISKQTEHSPYAKTMRNKLE